MPRVLPKRKRLSTASLLRHLFAIVVVLVIAGCGGGHPAMPDTLVASTDPAVPVAGDPVARPPLATVGERMTYQVSLHGVALAELRRFDEAIASHDRALKLKPGLTTTLPSCE